MASGPALGSLIESAWLTIASNARRRCVSDMLNGVKTHSPWLHIIILDEPATLKYMPKPTGSMFIASISYDLCEACEKWTPFTHTFSLNDHPNNIGATWSQIPLFGNPDEGEMDLTLVAMRRDWVECGWHEEFFDDDKLGLWSKGNGRVQVTVGLANNSNKLKLNGSFRLTKRFTCDSGTCLEYHSEWPRQFSADTIYLDRMKMIEQNGVDVFTRSGECRSLFGQTSMSFDMSTSFPLLTTKKMAWKSCVEELLWFLRGDTDTKILEAVGVTIWRGNTTREFLDSRGLQHLPEGEAGPNYSYQWRNFGGIWPDRTGGIDQINKVVESIRTDPHSRRHIVSAWNPKDLDATALPPCHILFQFYVDPHRRLSCQVYQRSADWFLGVPFNIASYALLTHIIAKKTDCTPHMLHMTFGDAHIYRIHKDACYSQMARTPMAQPIIEIDDSVSYSDWKELTFDHFKLINYNSADRISAPMVA